MQVTLTYGGKSQLVDREVVERQVVKAEATIAELRERMATRHADKRISAQEQAGADQRTAANIERYQGLVDACRAALA